MRTGSLVALLAAALALAGCFQSTTVIHVKADGSGTIEHTTMVTEMAVAQLQQFAAGMGGDTKSGGGFDPFSEADARKLAAALGPGVTYVASQPVKAAGAEGRRSTYAFSDISQVRLSQEPAMPGGAAIGSHANGAQAVTFSIAAQPDGNAVLTIHLPEPKLSGGAGAPGGAAAPTAGAAAGPTAAQMMMVKQMFAGARMTMAIEPAGHIVESSSPYVEGSRVTLLDMDFDRVMADDTAAARLQNVKTIEDARAALKDVPGLKITLDPEVTVLFSPER